MSPRVLVWMMTQQHANMLLRTHEDEKRFYAALRATTKAFYRMSHEEQNGVTVVLCGERVQKEAMQ